VKVLLLLLLTFNLALVAAQPSTAAAPSSTTTVVLLHGASTSARDFTHNLHNSLASRFRVISIDRPGHGYSERGSIDDTDGDTCSKAHRRMPQHELSSEKKQWMDPSRQARLILKALAQRQAENIILVGHSWAGAVVMAALLQEDPSVRAAVLIAGVTHPWEGDSAWHVRMAVRPVIGPIFSWQYIAPLGRLMIADTVANVLSPDTVPDNYIDNTGLTLSLRPQAFQHNAQDLTRLSQYLEAQSLHYPSIQQPILSIFGTADHVVPPTRHHDKLLTQIPTVSRCTMPSFNS